MTLQNLTPGSIIVGALIIGMSIISTAQMGGLERNDNDMDYQYSDHTLAVLEFKSLLGSCIDLTWNSSPSPQSPAQAIEFVNKCVHLHSNLDATRDAIETADYAFWPDEVIYPSAGGDGSGFLFKDPNYPNTR